MSCCNIFYKENVYEEIINEQMHELMEGKVSKLEGVGTQNPVDIKLVEDCFKDYHETLKTLDMSERINIATYEERVNNFVREFNNQDRRRNK